MRSRTLYIALLVVILAVQSLDYFLLSGGTAPAASFLKQIPRTLANWGFADDAVLDQSVLGALAPDDYLARYYQSADRKHSAELLIAYFKSQTEGFGPHSPKVCLPASGWTPILQTTRPIPNGEGGQLEANYFIIQNGANKSAVLYWYHTPARTMAGELEARFWLAWDTLSRKSSDIALVRVIVPIRDGQQEEATAAATDVATQVYRELRQHWRPS